MLGTVGSAVPVTSLTRVWAPTAGQRGWTADIEADPTTGAPIAVFSTRISNADHRYWWARWDGTAWQPEEMAYAGRALYGGEPDYTGLITLDPANPNRVVLSTDASPITGAPLVSTSDGQRHWELWRGQRSSGGTWAWQPLTADSTVDNLRPVIADHPQGASALLWMRGRYTTYLDYDLDVVGVITRRQRHRRDRRTRGAASRRPTCSPRRRPIRAGPTGGGPAGRGSRRRRADGPGDGT